MTTQTTNQDQQERIHKMLVALLKSNNQIQWAGAYAPGRTKTGDAYIILYPQNKKLQHKICRVYPHDFKLLPADIDTTIPAGVGNGNPTRDEAAARGILKPCKMFAVLTYAGRETQMGREVRFSDVLYQS